MQHQLVTLIFHFILELKKNILIPFMLVIYIASRSVESLFLDAQKCKCLKKTTNVIQIVTDL